MTDKSLPDGNPKTVYGVTKPAMHTVPTTALVHIAGVFGDGAEKYGPFNWRKDPVSCSVYYSAAMRHLMAWWDGEDIDPGSKRGAHHLGAVMANVAILLDAMDTGNLIDDRPPAGPTAAMIRAATIPD